MAYMASVLANDRWEGSNLAIDNSQATQLLLSGCKINLLFDACGDSNKTPCPVSLAFKNFIAKQALSIDSG